MRRFLTACGATVLGTTILGAALAGPAGAQPADRDVRRDTAPFATSAPGTGTGNTEPLVNELRDLIKKAERDRSADPRFLDALSDLAGRYEWRWPVAVLRDDFQDGDYTRNPPWTVAAGDFWIDGSALRTTVEAPRRERFESRGQGDTTAQVLGTVLQEVLRQPGGDPGAAGNRAEIFVDQPFSNAFAIRLTLTSRSDAGRLEFGPYQTSQRDIGYRLIYSVDDPPGLQLVRVLEGTGGVVEMVNRDLKLNDGRNHDILWTRDRDGTMAVALDGKTVMTTLDRGIQRTFQGFTIVNHGGDYGIREVAIDAAENLEARNR